MNTRILPCAAALCTAAFLSAACSHKAVVQTPVSSFNVGVSKIFGTNWRIEPPATTVVNLAYQDGHFVGSSGCNLYDATMQPKDNNGGVSIAMTLSTHRTCVPAVMDAERLFLSRLQAVTTMHVTNQDIFFTYDRGPDKGTIDFVPNHSLYRNYP
jgi:heat shock protein HslJ